MSEEIKYYILQFLLGTDDERIISQIGYTANKEEFEKYALVIKPSRFFDAGFYGAKDSLPALPLNLFDNTPILFGEPDIEKINSTIILHADVIASTYFMISRYEEMIRPDVRDKHGRFIGKESIAFKAGFIHRPIVQEYGKLLRKYLAEAGISLPETKDEIQTIYLTHDVDVLAHYKNIKSVLGAVLHFYKSPKSAFIALKTYFGSVESDPWFTFPWLFHLARKIKYADVRTIVFIKSGGGNLSEDKPIQNVKNRSFRKLFSICNKQNVYIGLHSSYEAGLHPDSIAYEKAILEENTEKKVRFNRNHYLCSREPLDFNYLIENHFTDDFTMGFADIAGFRLGTCKRVRWIDPENQKLTSLILHPLLIMDNTLSDERYMNLNEREAYDFALKLINEIKNNNGELVLLWHNNTVEHNNDTYHRSLYHKIINYLV
ncbi:MAG: polysaccharide deacetylase family protein [Paludibacteraceae bacterium]